MTPAQRAIQVQQDANRIFELLQIYQVTVVDGNIMFNDRLAGIRWDFDSINEHSGINDWDRTTAAIYRLLHVLWISRNRSEYLVTIFGVESYIQERKALTFNLGSASAEFKEEALTGCTPGGHQSKIEWAALPTGQRHEDSENTEERKRINMCGSVSEVRGIARDNDVSVEEAVMMIGTGEIKRCNKCGLFRKHHKHNGKNGQQWQPACIVCRKESRK
jgi:hypothetical protein